MIGRGSEKERGLDRKGVREGERAVDRKGSEKETTR